VLVADLPPALTPFLLHPSFYRLITAFLPYPLLPPSLKTRRTIWRHSLFPWWRSHRSLSATLTLLFFFLGGPTPFHGPPRPLFPLFSLHFSLGPFCSVDVWALREFFIDFFLLSNFSPPPFPNWSRLHLPRQPNGAGQRLEDIPSYIYSQSFSLVFLFRISPASTHPFLDHCTLVGQKKTPLLPFLCSFFLFYVLLGAFLLAVQNLFLIPRSTSSFPPQALFFSVAFVFVLSPSRFLLDFECRAAPPKLCFEGRAG